VIGRKQHVTPGPAGDVDAEEEAPILPESKVVGILKDEVEFLLALPLLFVEMDLDRSLSPRYEDGVPGDESDHGDGDGRRDHELVYDHVVEIGLVHGDERADDDFRAVGEGRRLPTDDAKPSRRGLVALVEPGFAIQVADDGLGGFHVADDFRDQVREAQQARSAHRVFRAEVMFFEPIVADDRDIHCSEPDPNGEEEKMMMIVESDAVIEPRAMMIHLEDTAFADAAMMGSRRLWSYAFLAY